MGAKRKSRIYAMQALFAYEVGSNSVDELLSLFWVPEESRERLGADLTLFTRTLIQGTIEHLSEIDENLKSHLANWNFDRIGQIDKAILRISLYEFNHITTTPHEVLIHEAVGLAKEYGTDNSYKFINGILHSIVKGEKK